jgi:hypothetical protein
MSVVQSSISRPYAGRLLVDLLAFRVLVRAALGLLALDALGSLVVHACVW